LKFGFAEIAILILQRVAARGAWLVIDLRLTRIWRTNCSTLLQLAPT